MTHIFIFRLFKGYEPKGSEVWGDNHSTVSQAWSADGLMHCYFTAGKHGRGTTNLR